jgi:hypothetical protein
MSCWPGTAPRPKPRSNHDHSDPKSSPDATPAERERSSSQVMRSCRTRSTTYAPRHRRPAANTVLNPFRQAADLHGYRHPPHRQRHGLASDSPDRAGAAARTSSKPSSDQASCSPHCPRRLSVQVWHCGEQARPTCAAGCATRRRASDFQPGLSQPARPRRCAAAFPAPELPIKLFQANWYDQTEMVLSRFARLIRGKDPRWGRHLRLRAARPVTGGSARPGRRGRPGRRALAVWWSWR